MMEVETGVMCLQTKELQGLPAMPSWLALLPGWPELPGHSM